MRRATGPARQGPRRRAGGMTLIEVAVSMVMVVLVVSGSMMVRYHAVKHAVRADAYVTASRVAQLFLEGWRSTELNVYEPYTRLHEQLATLEGSGAGPGLPAGFTMYTSPLGEDYYEILLDGIHFYATLGYIGPVTTVGSERPPVIHAAVGFMANHGEWDGTGKFTIVRLTSIK